MFKFKKKVDLSEKEKLEIRRTSKNIVNWFGHGKLSARTDLPKGRKDVTLARDDRIRKQAHNFDFQDGTEEREAKAKLEAEKNAEEKFE